MIRERPTQVRWVMFSLACAVSWLLYLHRYSWGVVKPYFRLEHPELTDVELGWLDSAFFATYAVGQIPGGLAGDVYGARGVLAAMILLWSLACAGIAWTAGFWRLCVVRALFGFAQAGGYPIVSKMTRNWFPLIGRTSVQGVITALGRIGAACSPLILATFLMGYCELSWQTALLLLCVPGIALAVAFWLLVRNRPCDHTWTNDAECRLIDGGVVTPTSAVPQPALALNRSSLMSFGMLLVYAFASTFQDQLYVNWIPSFLVEARGLDRATMGLFTPLPLIGGAVGGILGGFLNDYLIRVWGKRRWARSVVGLVGKAIAAVLILQCLHASDGRMAMVILLLARVFGDWSLPTQWGAITDMGGRAAATVFGVVNTVGAIGAVAAGPSLGYLREHYGWDGLFYGVVAMCLVASLSWLFIDCTRRVAED